MAHKKVTSKNVASEAGKALRDPKTPTKLKSPPIGSALSQSPGKHRKPKR